jgi:apolipoprotein N-acyltransferase
VVPLALTCLSAALYGLAFARPAFAPVAWVALVPFLAAVARVRPAAAAGLGFAMAIAGALGVTWWLPSMMTAYFGARPLAAWAGWLAVCTATIAPSLVCFAAWTSWLVTRGAAGPLVVAAGWGACELARARLWVGNPWALLAYSQMAWLRMMQIADATGPYGPGMLVAAVNTVVGGVFVPGLRGRHPIRSALAVAIAVMATLVYGAWRLGEPFGTGDPVRVAAVQPAVPASERRTEKGRALAVERQLEATRAAAAAGARVVVWPENSIDFYLDQASPERDALVASLATLDVDVVAGGPSYVYGDDGVRYRNSVYLLQHGSVAGRYDKLHLVPFAETTYVAGTHPYALRSRAGLIGTFVCFEAMYPDLVRRLVVGGANLLANPTNDAWFGAGTPARMHLDMARLRAVEERRWLVRATTTGISAIVDPHGRVVAETTRDVPAVLDGTVRACTTVTIYQRWGDLAAWLAVGIVTAATMVTYVRGRIRLHGGEA